MISAIAAEISKVVRRPAPWVLIGLISLLAAVFRFIVPYTLAQNGGPAGFSGQTVAPLDPIAALLPDQLVSNGLSGLPLFGAAIALILGTLVMGSEYAWNTNKTVLVQGPSRSTVTLARLASVAFATLALTVAVFTTGAAISTVIALLEDRVVAFPPAWELARALGAGWLIVTVWGVLGAMLATVARNPSLPIGIGLFWLAAERLTEGFAAVSSVLAIATEALIGPNGASLVAAIAPVMLTDDTPGIGATFSVGHALTALAVWAAAAASASVLIARRRDVA
jgi:ABC-2 type transport system permease protein